MLNQLRLLDETRTNYVLKTVQGFLYKYRLPKSLPVFLWGLFSLLLSLKKNVATGNLNFSEATFGTSRIEVLVQSNRTTEDTGSAAGR